MGDYSNFTDNELSVLLSKGDDKAFAEMYNRYWPLLFRHARRLLQNDQQSKDVVQDVFISLWAQRELNQPDALSGYLYSATRNKILNIFRKDKIAHAHLESLGKFMKEGENVTDYLVRERTLAKLIEEEIANLPARMREVFELKRKQNLSYSEIAVQMDISELTVKTQMNKAITRLKGKFGDSLYIFMPFL